MQEGQVLGEVDDLKGDIIEQIIAPPPSAVIMMYPKHVVNEEDPLLFIAPVVELPLLELNR